MTRYIVTKTKREYNHIGKRGQEIKDWNEILENKTVKTIEFDDLNKLKKWYNLIEDSFSFFDTKDIKKGQTFAGYRAIKFTEYLNDFMNVPDREEKDNVKRVISIRIEKRA